MSDSVKRKIGSFSNAASNHAKQRTLQRYGRYLPEETAQRMIDDIHAGRAVYLGKGNESGVAIFAVLLDYKAVPVVYSKKTKTIVTIMHRSAIPKMLGKRLQELHATTN